MTCVVINANGLYLQFHDHGARDFPRLLLPFATEPYFVPRSDATANFNRKGNWSLSAPLGRCHLQGQRSSDLSTDTSLLYELVLNLFLLIDHEWTHAAFHSSSLGRTLSAF